MSGGIFTVISRLWEYIMLLIAAANTVLLLAYDYGDRSVESKRNKIFNALEIAFTGLYILECVIKVIAYGLFAPPKGYLKSVWNCLDLFIAAIGYL